MKKFLALFGALLIIFATACENVTYIEESSQVEESSKGIYEQLESNLPDLDNSEEDSGEIELRPFKIITNDTAAFYQEETTASSISKAIEERNTFLRYKYGAEVEVIAVNEKDVLNELKNAVQAGTHYCDMISISARKTVGLYSAGLLQDLNKLPDFSIENDYFQEDMVKSLATNNSLYMIADPTALIYDETYVLFYNRNLVKTEEGSSLESLVEQGKWTWDLFYETAKAAAPKVYNSWSADMDTDTFGFGTYYKDGTFPMVLWTSVDKPFVSNTYKNPVGFTISVDEITNVTRELDQYYNSRGTFPLEGNDASETFEEERIAFFCNKLKYIYQLRDGSDLGSQYGVLPLPKYNEEQEGYCCLVGNDARLISVPVTVGGQDEGYQKYVSTVISATCAAGGATIHDAYINSLLALYSNSNEETLMFKTICNSATFDFSNVYGSDISAIRGATVSAICDYFDYGSMISTTIAYAQGRFDNYVKTNFNQTP